MKVKYASTRVYWPSCAICQYMRKHQDFRLAMLNSSYFNKHGVESPTQVMARYGVKELFKMNAMYAHFKRHQFKDIANKAKAASPQYVNGIPLEILATEEGAPAEIGLEQFIKLGSVKLRRGEMPINASTYLQAIKINLDNKNRSKDRGADLFKTMFKGAAPTDGQPEGS